MFDLSGKVAVVTGSSRGIGRAIAVALAHAGANVVVSSRRLESCRAVAEAINRAAGEERAVAQVASISSKDQLAELVASTEARWGRIDILVCNAAANPYYGPIAEISDEQFRKTVDNNILSTIWLTRLVVPGMAQRRDGSIIIVSSIGGLLGSAAIGAYNISKAGDMQLARNLAVEHGPFNVRVNCIAPGLVRTDFARALWEDPEVLRRMTTAVPLRRIAEPDEIAGTAVFLASRAATFVTGTTIVVDGGATIAAGF